MRNEGSVVAMTIVNRPAMPSISHLRRNENEISAWSLELTRLDDDSLILPRLEMSVPCGKGFVEINERFLLAFLHVWNSVT
jgi:hypothetical protein